MFLISLRVTHFVNYEENKMTKTWAFPQQSNENHLLVNRFYALQKHTITNILINVESLHKINISISLITLYTAM